MSYEDTIRGLRILSTVALGHFAGASMYTAVAIQPALIEQSDVVTSSKIMSSLLQKSASMPVTSMLSALSSIALYFKTRHTSREDIFWLISGTSILAMFPYTIYYIGPINAEFRFTEQFDENDSKWSKLLSDWLFYHKPRAVLTFALFAASVYKLSK